MLSNVKLEVAGGPFVQVPWKAGQKTQPRTKIDSCWPVSFSSNLARIIWRLEGNRETGETVGEETKKAKFLMDQDFPITLEDFC